MSLDPCEIARFIVTQGNWSDAYGSYAFEAQELGIPPGYYALKMEEVRSDAEPLLREIRLLIPGVLFGCAYQDTDVIFALPAEVEKARARILQKRQRDGHYWIQPQS